MSSGHVARRLPALALVAAAHAVTLLLLVTLTRTHLLRVSPEVSPLLVVTLASLPSSPPAGPAGVTHQPTRPRPNSAPGGRAARLPPTSAQALAGVGAIDWTGDADTAAAEEIRKDEEARRQSGAFGLRWSAAFVGGSTGIEAQDAECGCMRRRGGQFHHGARLGSGRPCGHDKSVRAGQSSYGWSA